uniref:Putative secreted peptide n=1 Tax=Anopheles braziliensis TaxID=58242 RepID=A0A2M3ZN69_9DIPT
MRTLRSQQFRVFSSFCLLLVRTLSFESLFCFVMFEHPLQIYIALDASRYLVIRLFICFQRGDRWCVA